MQTSSGSNVSSEERILGGVQVAIEQFPWQLSLRMNGNHICGASVLSATRGLTAGRCINVGLPISQYSVLAGTKNRIDIQNGFVTQLTRFIRHPRYYLLTFENDLGVIWFARMLPLTQRIRPILLPPQDAAVPYGVTAAVSGW